MKDLKPHNKGLGWYILWCVLILQLAMLALMLVALFEDPMKYAQTTEISTESLADQRRGLYGWVAFFASTSSLVAYGLYKSKSK